MILQQASSLIVFLLPAVLIGPVPTAAQNASARVITCYQGMHTTISASFPFGYGLCRAYDGEFCVEVRWRNWETTVGFAQVSMGCGYCGSLNSTDIECRECSTNSCNVNFAKELMPQVAKLKNCYASLEKHNRILPDPVLCPHNQNCSTGKSPESDKIMVGCEAHCKKFNWTDCEYCDTVLCNDRGDVVQLDADGENSDLDGKPIGVARIVTASDAVVSSACRVARGGSHLALAASVVAAGFRLIQQ